MKKLLSFVLVLAVLLSMAVLPAAAEEKATLRRGEDHADLLPPLAQRAQRPLHG